MKALRFLLLLGALVLVSAMHPDYYQLLGVERNATMRSLKKAYHKIALELHPDKLGPFDTREEEKEAESEFIKLAEAYEVLSDPVRRKRYDMHGPDSQSSQDQFGETFSQRQYTDDFFDMYIRFDGGAFEFHYHPTRSKKNGDTVNMLNVQLEDLLNGTLNHTVRVERQIICPFCNGTRAGDQERMHTCPVCAGSGHHLFLHDHGEYKHAINTTCHHCNGTGDIPETECGHCHGTGLIQEIVELVVETPAGAPPGHKITLAGDGNQAHGYDNGDLVFIVALEPHPRFEVQGEQCGIYHS
jgi:molecular chaperone DnaJ